MGLFLASGSPLLSELRTFAADSNYSFSLVKTNTALHRLPQHRIHTFYFFWRSPTAPLLRYVNMPRPKLVDFLQAIPPWAEYQDVLVQPGSVTDRFKPYLYILLRERYICREQVDHKQFVQKLARENRGSISVLEYLEKWNVLDDCISWMKHYFPHEKFETTTLWKDKTIVEYFEQCKKSRARGLKNTDRSPRFLGTYGVVRFENIMYGVHPVEERFLNIREVMALVGLPHDYKVHNSVTDY